MKIGVGVEGPSDFQFWSKVLPKFFRGWQFDIRNMKNRSKLVGATPDLVEEFRGRKQKAAVIILDRDDDPCVKSVLNTFDPSVVAEATKQPAEDRFVHICLAVKKLECWYLADATAIEAVIPGAEWCPATDTANCNGKREIEQLLRSKSKVSIGYNEIDFAKGIAPKFDPGRAEVHSASFRHVWKRLSLICSPRA